MQSFLCLNFPFPIKSGKQMPALLQSRNKILNPERYMAETFPVNCLSMKGTRMKIYQKDMLVYYMLIIYIICLFMICVIIYYLGTRGDFHFTHHRNEKPTHQCKDLHYPLPSTLMHPIKVSEKGH